jgi:predicted TPR repeat methyltransferase
VIAPLRRDVARTKLMGWLDRKALCQHAAKRRTQRNRAMDYDAKLREQQSQYASGADLEAIPPILSYWIERFMAPRLQAVFDTSVLTRLYSTPLKRLLRAKRGHCRFVSLGSGTCTEEIKIARDLRADGFSNFTILGLDVTEHLVAEANAAIAREKLTEHVASRFFDVNRDAIEGPVDAVIAHQSLHHFVELERVFDLVDAALVPQGYFLSCDMIGRNGHMRWPETCATSRRCGRTCPRRRSSTGSSSSATTSS